MTIATDTHITIREEDFLVFDVNDNHKTGYIIEAEDISELGKDKRVRFDTNLDSCEVLHSANAQLGAVNEAGYRKTRHFLKTQLRIAASTSTKSPTLRGAVHRPPAKRRRHLVRPERQPRVHLLKGDD